MGKQVARKLHESGNVQTEEKEQREESKTSRRKHPASSWQKGKQGCGDGRPVFKKRTRPWPKEAFSGQSNCNGPPFNHAARDLALDDEPGECQQAPAEDRQARSSTASALLTGGR